MHEHVFLVGVVVRTDLNREQAELNLHERLNTPAFRGDVGNDEVPHVDSWWIAEDERNDHSDLESAVFIPEGSGISQREARAMLEGRWSL